MPILLKPVSENGRSWNRSDANSRCHRQPPSNPSCWARLAGAEWRVEGAGGEWRTLPAEVGGCGSLCLPNCRQRIRQRCWRRSLRPTLMERMREPVSACVRAGRPGNAPCADEVQRAVSETSRNFSLISDQSSRLRLKTCLRSGRFQPTYLPPRGVVVGWKPLPRGKRCPQFWQLYARPMHRMDSPRKTIGLDHITRERTGSQTDCVGLPGIGCCAARSHQADTHGRDRHAVTRACWQDGH